MRDEELKALFDQQAAGYDERWAKTAPIRDNLHFLLPSVFAGLPGDARLLCVGVGTGAEIAHLAERFPAWHFTAVEPSGAMLDLCRARAEAEGYAARCHFHEGYLDSLDSDASYDGATCFLVSQFILNEEARTAFFHGIAKRLRPGGVLASSDLASDVTTPAYSALLQAWLNMMSGTLGMQADGLERMRAAYAKDVAILPPQRVAAIIEAAGFAQSVQFFQAGLIHAWFSIRKAL